MHKVSVIIPVYNVERYLSRCLDSLIKQTLKDIEIICVDDCSTDKSLEILKEYYQQDKRIKIIEFKQNKGVSLARNAGMEIAHGEYIGFVDADDWVDRDFYEKLFNKSQEQSFDIVLGNTYKVTDEGKYEYYNEIRAKIKENKSYFNELFYIGIYKNDLLLKYSINFPPNCNYGEDRLLPVKSSFFADSIGFVDDSYYYYYMRAGSLTKNMNIEKTISFINSSELILNFINSVELHVDNYNIIYNKIWENTFNLLTQVNDRSFFLLKEFCINSLSNVKYKNVLSSEKISAINFLIENDIDNLNKYIRTILNKKMFTCLRERHKFQINKNGVL